MRIELKGVDGSAKERIKDAEKRKKASEETIEEAWLRILAMKNSATDAERLRKVKTAMEEGKIGREPVAEGKKQKRFSKAEALRLFSVLDEQEAQERLAEMVRNTPENYELVLTKEQLNEATNILYHEELIVFDVESTGVDVYNDKIVGHVLSATSKDLHFYIPTDHDDNTPQLQRHYVAEKLRPLYESSRIGFIAHNAKFDMQIMENDLGIKVGNLVWDTMEGMKLLNENEPSFALKNLATKYLGDKSYTYGQLFGNRGFNEIDLKTALAYAAKDGDITYKLYKFQRKHLAEHGNILRYFEEVEMPLLSIVSDMELRGYDIDTEYAKSHAEVLRTKAGKAHERVAKEFGDEVNLNSPAQLKTAIESHIGKSIENTDAKKTLKPLAKDFPIISDLLEYREVSKLLSTYYDALPELINPKTGRIHTRLHQNGAKTGRFSSGGGGSFNIQNQSGDARKMFVAPDGYYIVNADFASQEVRIVASVSGEEVLLNAFAEGLDAYATLASEFFGKPYEECYKLPNGDDTPERKQMKVVLLSSMYGASKYGLSGSLGISTEEAEEFRLSFFDKYRKIDEFIKRSQEHSKKHGFVWIGDKARKRRLPEARMKEIKIPWGKYNDSKYADDKVLNGAIRRSMRQSGNAIVQGLAAIQTKVTMVNIEKESAEREWSLWSTTHDELQLLMKDDEKLIDNIRRLDHFMKYSYVLPGVDNDTDIEIQRRWSDSITFEEYLSGKEVPQLN